MNNEKDVEPLYLRVSKDEKFLMKGLADRDFVSMAFWARRTLLQALEAAHPGTIKRIQERRRAAREQGSHQQPGAAPLTDAEIDAPDVAKIRAILPLEMRERLAAMNAINADRAARGLPRMAVIATGEIRRLR